LIGHDGQITPIKEIYDTGIYETVYNLRVSNEHTYFVGDDSWGWSVWVHNEYLYRAITDQDYAEYASNLFTMINPRGSGGTILEHIEGNGAMTKYISASQSYRGTAKFRPTSDGVIVINKDMLMANGSGIVNHATLLATAANSINPGLTRKNVKDADEVLITKGIPKAAIVNYISPNEFNNYNGE
jgi:hypothetical protein